MEDISFSASRKKEHECWEGTTNKHTHISHISGTPMAFLHAINAVEVTDYVPSGIKHQRFCVEDTVLAGLKL